MEKIKMVQGEMYQVINGEPVQVVRHGDELLPITDPRVHQCLGQLVLEIFEEES
jgi:hypothetical protein